MSEEELRGQVEELARMVGGVMDVLEEIQGRSPGVTKPPTPAWALVTAAAPTPAGGPEADLEAWVSWAIAAYEVQHWPSCWAQHRGLVLELVCFRQLWAEAASSSTGHELSVWHQSWAQFLRRAPAALEGCRGGRSHKVETGPPAAGPGGMGSTQTSVELGDGT
jgi:hypothetical protein